MDVWGACHVVDTGRSAGMWACNWVWGKSRRFLYFFCLVDVLFGQGRLGLSVTPIPISEELENLWKGGVVLSPGGAEKVPNPLAGTSFSPRSAWKAGSGCRRRVLVPASGGARARGGTRRRKPAVSRWFGFPPPPWSACGREILRPLKNRSWSPCTNCNGVVADRAADRGAQSRSPISNRKSHAGPGQARPGHDPSLLPQSHEPERASVVASQHR